MAAHWRTNLPQGTINANKGWPSLWTWSIVLHGVAGFLELLLVLGSGFVQRGEVSGDGVGVLLK